jgi:anti-anti-sigma factor
MSSPIEASPLESANEEVALLRAELATMQELLAAQEQAALKQSRSLEHALYALELHLDQQKHSNEEQQRMQQEMIRLQDALLSELSTPLIPVSHDVVIMPLIGTIDARRARQMLDVLLDGVSKNRARIAILDITGVAKMDTHVAGTIVSAAKAVRLLGTQVVLTGIRSEVAISLVQLGVPLGEIKTCSDLRTGIDYAMRTAGK